MLTEVSECSTVNLIRGDPFGFVELVKVELYPGKGSSYSGRIRGKYMGKGEEGASIGRERRWKIEVSFLAFQGTEMSNCFL